MIANSFQILLGETFRGFQDIRFASIFGGVLSTAIFTITLGGIVYFKWISLTLHSTILFWVLSLALSNGLGLLILARKIQLLMKEAETDQKRTLPGQKHLFDDVSSYGCIVLAFTFLVNVIYGSSEELGMTRMLPYTGQRFQS